MTLILTFLGKGGTGRTTVAIAAAKRFVQSGKRVLLAIQDCGPAPSLLLGFPLTPDPQQVISHLFAVQLQASVLLERSWEQVKQVESQYLRSPFFKEVYGQELGILPGMDQALGLNQLREYDARGDYDVIIYDGIGDQITLRMLGIPEILSWYVRRFRQVLTASDFGKTLGPLLQPLLGTVLNVDWATDLFAQPAHLAGDILSQGKAAIADPHRVLAYLITTGDPAAIATARYLWGSAQQIGLTVGGVLLNQGIPHCGSSLQADAFSPLVLTHLPAHTASDWQPLISALPSLTPNPSVPRPMTINLIERQVSLFLPGFNKSQVTLTQSGPEVTIEAGDQRHNIALPPELAGQPVTAAKFHNSYLVITFAK